MTSHGTAGRTIDEHKTLLAQPSAATGLVLLLFPDNSLEVHPTRSNLPKRCRSSTALSISSTPSSHNCAYNSSLINRTSSSTIEHIDVTTARYPAIIMPSASYAHALFGVRQTGPSSTRPIHPLQLRQS
ncbi:hypothetical protein BDV93DRAFT_529208 [Ceratobasidium sp. AG-I]|nr:hypothetical protein BDV93DRAFT_529208 [Ceratobasidium sp. AG-I]